MNNNIPRDQRLALYKDAEQILNEPNEIQERSLTGLCKTLGYAAIRLGLVSKHTPMNDGVANRYYRINLYPELYRRRPSGQTECSFWWEEMIEPESTGIAPRKKMLRQAIRELEYRIRTERKPKEQ